LTLYESTHGLFPLTIAVKYAQTLCVDGDVIRVYSSDKPENLAWKEEQIDVVLECTGAFGAREDAMRHIDAGAKRVLFSHPADAESDVDRTVVYGVNHEALNADDRIVSSASCTSNAIVPVIDALDRAFGIEAGTLTTIHSAMNDQPTIDAYHHRDLRRTRSAMQNMVPVDTALAKGVERLLPHMTGKLSAVAMRVPTVNVSALDLTLYVRTKTDAEAVNQVMAAAADNSYDGILAYTQEPLASSDFNHDSHSGTVDGSQTRVSAGSLVKVLTWFDNEWAFANRMLDVTRHWIDGTSSSK